MNKHFKANERELIKVATFFKKQSKKLIFEGKIGEEHKTVEEAVDRFIEHMNTHANIRAFVLEQRDYLNKLVKDNAQCPQCHTNNMLKFAGTEKNEKGWKSNRYKCRKCNIIFTWNMPSNPWDMIQYIEEVLLSAEYIMSGGNYEVILCERGIRTFETATRNTMDISAIPVLKQLTHLPVIADPSHGVGKRTLVPAMARAAVAAGADGLLIEVHHDPDHALSDGAQSLFPEQFSELMGQLRMIATAVGRSIAG